MEVRPLLLALLLTLTCVTLGTGKPDTHDEDHEDHHDDQDDHDDHMEDYLKIDHRLDKLTSRIQKIKKKIERRTDPRIITRARSLRARVQNIEGK